MRVSNLTADSQVYTSNVFLVLGAWSGMADVNTLVDVGADSKIFALLEEASTGVGKKRVEQVVLTHSHYDHTTLLPRIREVFRPRICACSSYLEGVDVILRGGERLQMGDREFEVIHTPGHTDDSLCLYCEEDRVLFSGDTPLVILTTEGSYEDRFVSALEELCSRKVDSIYFGHGPPLMTNASQVLRRSLANVLASRTLSGGKGANG